VLFRGTRELLMNAVKHAQATRATVTVRGSDEGIELTVADDGRGFDVGRLTADGASGFGLFSIRDRLPHLGGELAIDSAPGQGTRVTLRMPWSQ
jgi:signal transduction histidine kinase